MPQPIKRYGLIDLNLLDNLIFEMKKKINETFDPIEVKTYRGALIAYLGIKAHCQTLSSIKESNAPTKS